MPKRVNPLSLKTLSLILLESLAHKGGATIDWDTGEEPSTGFIVSLPGGEMRLCSPPTTTLVEGWIMEYALGVSAVAEAQGLTPYLGVWADKAEGRIYFDVSVVIPSERMALAMAEKWGQKAVFDVAHAVNVYLAPVNA
jgi:hypothetical protein